MKTGRINGFSLMAESYRKLVEQGRVEAEEVKRNIEIYEFFGTCSADDFCKMVDTSAFNGIITAYTEKALTSAGVDGKTKDRVISELKCLFDTMTAAEVSKPKQHKIKEMEMER